MGNSLVVRRIRLWGIVPGWDGTGASRNVQAGELGRSAGRPAAGHLAGLGQREGLGMHKGKPRANSGSTLYRTRLCTWSNFLE